MGNTCSFVGCDSTVYTGINTASPLPPPKEEELQVYPNPAQDYLTISNLSTQQNVTFVLYDVLGREQLRQALSPNNSTSLSTQTLLSGVYLYHILNPQKQVLAYGKVSILR